jgi:prepilin-type N-terminal cleavage/methylation domain-containing protein
MAAYRNILRRKMAGFTLVEIMIVVLIIGILLAIAIPNFITARSSSRARACVANLKEIDSAKQQYIMDQKLGALTDPGAPNFLVGTYLKSTPACPASGTYDTGGYTVSPTCSYGTTDGSLYLHQLPS